MNFKSFSALLSVLFLTLISCDEIPNWFSKKKEEGQPWVENSAQKPLTVPWKGQAVGADTFIQIAQKADLGVVNIGTTQIIKNNKRRAPMFEGQESPFDEFFGGDLFKHFFGEESQEQPEVRRPSLGSGFIINKEGLIVTNNHVVEKASEITVTIGQDHEYKAKLIGADPKTDVAIIKIEPKEELHPLTLGDSDALMVGEIVVAIGNPFGLSHTVTQGIVSAKARTIGFGPYDDFIQTDASINPGNSGGPLLNLEAKVVGINAAIVASAQGIGFAIPINTAKNIIEQLQTKGSVTRGWLGVYIQKVDPDLAKSLGLKDRRGALVSGVQKASPAEKVGLKARDVIVEVNGKPISDFNELPRLVALLPVGQKVNLKVVRDGKEIMVSPVVGILKNDEEPLEENKKDSGSRPSEPDQLGLTVETLTKQEAAQRGIEEDRRGVMVQKISPSSKAAEKGIQRGDIIVEVNKVRVKTAQEYAQVVKGLKKGDSVLMLVERPGAGSLFIAFEN